MTDSVGQAPADNRRALLLVLFLVTLTGFVALGLVYEHEPFATIDLRVSEWVFLDSPDWVGWLARPFSWLGGWIGLTLLAVFAIVVLSRERAWGDLVFFLTAYLGTQVLVALLKASFDRLRPEVGSAVPLPATPSFPSGHATAGIAALGAFAVLAAERIPSRRGRARFWWLVAVVGVTVGLSRIALNVHFVTDVLAGWCLGLAWLSACLLVRDALRERPRPDLVAQSHRVD